MNDLPVWAKVVAQVWFPIAMTIWLLVYVSPLIADTNVLMKRHVIDNETRVILLRAICRNTAQTMLQSQVCDTDLLNDPAR